MANDDLMVKLQVMGYDKQQVGQAALDLSIALNSCGCSNIALAGIEQACGGDPIWTATVEAKRPLDG